MEVLTEQELTARVDYRAPLHDEPEPRRTPWCIPFEYGGNKKGTCITVPLAKQIVAELRAAIAEQDLREMRRYFDQEKERADSLSHMLASAQEGVNVANAEIANLLRRARARVRKTGSLITRAAKGAK